MSINDVSRERVNARVLEQSLMKAIGGNSYRVVKDSRGRITVSNETIYEVFSKADVEKRPVDLRVRRDGPANAISYVGLECTVDDAPQFWRLASALEAFKRNKDPSLPEVVVETPFNWEVYIAHVRRQQTKDYEKSEAVKE